MPSILFADDDALQADAFARELEDAGYQVTVASTARETLRLARARHFDIVLLDMVMPPGREFSASESAGGYKTGIALAREIRNLLPTSMIVAFTMSNDPEVLEWFSDDPLLGYVNKAETLELGLPAILELIARPDYRTPPDRQDEPGDTSVFISHSSADKPFVRRLARAIEKRGIRVWLDEHSIDAGDSIMGEVSEGILRNSHFVLVLSPASVGSEWVRRELDLALSRDISTRANRVLPVLLRDCEIPPAVRSLRFVDMRKMRGFSRGIDELLRSISAASSK